MSLIIDLCLLFVYSGWLRICRVHAVRQILVPILTFQVQKLPLRKPEQTGEEGDHAYIHREIG